jgi:ketosteroid isomerase-like protein
MANKFDSFSDLLRAALGDRLVKTREILDFFTADVVFEFPYAPEGMPRRLDGREALARHFAQIGPLLEFGELSLGPVHDAGDTVVFRFSCRGKGVRTGRPYDQDYVSVVQLRDGRIAHYLDYWNPLAVISALGGLDAAIAAFGTEASHD